MLILHHVLSYLGIVDLFHPLACDDLRVCLQSEPGRDDTILTQNQDTEGARFSGVERQGGHLVGLVWV